MPCIYVMSKTDINAVVDCIYQADAGRRQRGLKNRIPEIFETTWPKPGQLTSHPRRYLCEHASRSEYVRLYLEVSAAQYELRFVDRQVRRNISDFCVKNPYSSHRSGACACDLLCASPPIICFQNQCQDFP